MTGSEARYAQAGGCRLELEIQPRLAQARPRHRGYDYDNPADASFCERCGTKRSWRQIHERTAAALEYARFASGAAYPFYHSGGGLRTGIPPQALPLASRLHSILIRL